MEQFIKAFFWIAIIGEIIRILLIGYSPYPRKIDKDADIISAIISIPFLIWSAILLWGVANVILTKDRKGV